MASRASEIFGSLLPAELRVLSATNQSQSWFGSWLIALSTEPRSEISLKATLPAAGFNDSCGCMVSLPVQLGILKKKNAISLRAESFGGLTLLTGARIPEFVREKEYFLRKVFSSIQAEGHNLSDLLNGVTDLQLSLQICSLRIPKGRSQDSDPAARSIEFYPLASLLPILFHAVIAGSRFSSDSGVLTLDSRQLSRSAFKASDHKP